MNIARSFTGLIIIYHQYKFFYMIIQSKVNTIVMMFKINISKAIEFGRVKLILCYHSYYTSLH